jgi:hypothetical protein
MLDNKVHYKILFLTGSQHREGNIVHKRTSHSSDMKALTYYAAQMLLL